MVHRLALSRIEILICLLVAGLVVGLCAVGVVQVRDAAQQTQCANNLKQLGIAVHGYHDAHDALPPFVDQGPGSPTGTGLPSVFAVLMPYIEADPWNYRGSREPAEYLAHSSVPFLLRSKNDEPLTVHGGIANQARRTFHCPADITHPLRDVPLPLPDGTPGYYATGNYATNGLVPWRIGSIPDDFPRGAGDTVLMAERPQVCRTATGDTVYNLWGVGFYSPHMPAFACLAPDGFRSTGQVAPVEPLPPEGGEPLLRTGRADAAPGPADFPTPLQLVRDGWPCDPRLPGGPHRAGMQVLRADGSVRVFGWDTTPWAFWDACLPDGPGDGR